MKPVHFLFLVFFLLSTTAMKAQTYCSAGSSGAGNLFGGNIISIVIEDDTGIMYAYKGFTNNSKEEVINQGSPYKMVSWDTFIFSMTGMSDSTGNAIFTKAGIWIDMNRDGNFSASECIADPATGPFKHLRKDTETTVAIRIPGPFTVGASRIRIRGAAGNQTLTASDGCGSLSVYGNQFDFEVALIQGVNHVNNIGKGKPNFLIYPNPTNDGFVSMDYNMTGIGNTEVVIYDFTGKECYTQKENLSGTGQLKLDLRALEIGFYIVKIRCGNNVYSRRLQIN